MTSRIITICLILLSATGLVSQDWPQWRGPNRDGVVTDFKPPQKWPDELSLQWRTDLPAGISSPVVSNDRIYLFAREGDQELALCVNARDGKEIWRSAYPSIFVPNSQAVRPQLFPNSEGKGPFATPLLHNGRLYTLGVDRIVTCFDTENGKQLWQHHYFTQQIPDKLVYQCAPCGCPSDGKTFDKPGTCPDCGMAFSAQGLDTSVRQGGNYYGAATSPLAFGENIIIHVGNADESAMIALDAKSGEERWRWSGQAMSSCSPVIATLQGEPQIINLTRFDLVGVSAKSGELLWSFPVESNAQIVTPVLFEDTVIFSTYRGPATAVEVRKEGDRWSATQLWSNNDVSFYMSSPVLKGERLYALSYTQRGQFVCVDARTGTKIWESEGRQAYGASLVLLGDVLAALKNDGDLLILESTADSYNVLQKYKLTDNPVWAHPIFRQDGILVRDEAQLSLWRLQ